MKCKYVCYHLFYRAVESEVENNQAQLSRFQLHLSSVKEDIQLMEERLRSVIMACKKNQVLNWPAQTTNAFFFAFK